MMNKDVDKRPTSDNVLWMNRSVGFCEFEIQGGEVRGVQH